MVGLTPEWTHHDRESHPLAGAAHHHHRYHHHQRYYHHRYSRSSHHRHQRRDSSCLPGRGWSASTGSQACNPSESRRSRSWNSGNIISGLWTGTFPAGTRAGG